MSTETDTKTQQKRSLTDVDIADFINQVSKKRLKQVQESLTTDQIASIGFSASQLYEAVSRIVEYPTKFQIDDFKQSTSDNRLLYLLQSPEVHLALEWKYQYDLGRLDIFDKILKFDKNEGLDLKDDDIVLKFINNAQYFLPSIPQIEDEELKQNFHDGGDLKLNNLSSYGKSYFKTIVDSYLIQRFSDREIRDMSVYTTNPKIATKWAQLYQLPLNDDIPPADMFFAYIGALASEIPYNTDRDLKSEIKNWMTIILEPILMCFDNANELKVNGKDEIRSRLGNVEFRNIYKSTHPEPIYIVQIYAGGEILVGTSSSKSLAEAEAKASTAALYDAPLLDKVERILDDIKRESMSVSPYIEPQAYNNGVAGAPVGIAPQPVHPHPIYPDYQQQQPQQQQQPNGYPMEPTNAVVQPNYMTPQDPMQAYPQTLINEEYQRKLQEESESVLEAPSVTDEASIDSSSKEKLNQLLTKRRIGPAEYKTAKLNNSDVQVTCYIENIPIAKAVSTNKKKAGQICAQYILNYPEYFLQRFAGR